MNVNSIINVSNNEIIANCEMQARVLDRLFNCGKGFNRDWIVRTRHNFPNWAEEYMVCCDWRKIASSYGEAVGIVLKKIAHFLPDYHVVDNLIDHKFLNQTAKSVGAWEELVSKQGRQNTIVFPAQFGNVRYRGCSILRACELMDINEFGLGAFAVATVFVTFPQLLDDVWKFIKDKQQEAVNNRTENYKIMFFGGINCAGDEYLDENKPEGSMVCSSAPFFMYSEMTVDKNGCDFKKRILVSTTRPYSEEEGFGVASGFVPQD